MKVYVHKAKRGALQTTEIAPPPWPSTPVGPELGSWEYPLTTVTPETCTMEPVDNRSRERPWQSIVVIADPLPMIEMGRLVTMPQLEASYWPGPTTTDTPGGLPPPQASTGSEPEPGKGALSSAARRDAQGATAEPHCGTSRPVAATHSLGQVAIAIAQPMLFEPDPRLSVPGMAVAVLMVLLAAKRATVARKVARAA